MADEGKPGSPNVDILIDGQEIPDGDITSWSVSRSMGMPDRASVTVTNQSDVHSGKFGKDAPFVVAIGKQKEKIFIGTLKQSSPSTGNDRGAKAALSAANGLNKLVIGDKTSFTFQDKNDKQMLEKVVSDAGLTLDYKGPTIVYKHVYQHNLSPWEFLLHRADRIGCHVWGWDKKVFAKVPDFSKTAKTKLSVDKAGILRQFKPEQNPGAALKKVTIKAWDPAKKELITHTETASGSKLGSKHASQLGGGGVATLTVSDEPVGSKQEAEALAKAKLLDRNLNFVTATAVCAGTADFDLADVVEIEQNATGQDPFNGKYYIHGIEHKHVLSGKASQGYVTTLYLLRDAVDG